MFVCPCLEQGKKTAYRIGCRSSTSFLCPAHKLSHDCHVSHLTPMKLNLLKG